MQVALKASFLISHASDSVQLSLWYSANNDRSLDLLKDLGDYLKPVIKEIDFQPRFVHWNCPHCDSDFKRDNCVSDGQYCAMQDEFSDSMKGKDLVMEHLRQHCLYKLLKQRKQPDLFFDYITNVHELCESRITEKCSNHGLNSIDFPLSNVQNCVVDSFEGAGSSAARF
mmetsp:Transcript_9305/g.15684  ORF Transcript_9305/g.15684 Transcript_9305/m.15684 type:complete len:170 (+) Transcript_9305:535-1044(+)